jgi:Icc protein
MQFVLAQISDLHVTTADDPIGGFLDTAPYLSAAVEHVNGLSPAPDLLLITGDLVNNGRPAEYARLAELLAPLRVRYVLLAGNHDDRTALRAAFADQPWEPGPANLRGVVEHPLLRLVLLDSVVPGEPGGQVGAEQLDWLDGVLGPSPTRPTIVALHHPPFETGIEHMDAMGLADAGALAAVIGAHPNVEAVVCGHLHRSITTRWAGTVALTVPGIAHQVGLDLAAGAPVSFTMEPPAVALHVWRDGHGAGRLVTHLSFIGPYPPTVVKDNVSAAQPARTP